MVSHYAVASEEPFRATNAASESERPETRREFPRSPWCACQAGRTAPL